MPLPIWRSGGPFGRLALNANGTFWVGSSAEDQDRYHIVITIRLYDLFGNVLATTVSDTVTDKYPDFAFTVAPSGRVFLFESDGEFLLTYAASGERLSVARIPSGSPGNRIGLIEDPVIATASDTSGMLVFTEVYRDANFNFSTYVYARPFNPATGQFTADAVQLTGGKLAQLIALADGRYAAIAVNDSTLFLLDPTATPIATLVIADRSDLRLAALTDAGFVAVGRDGSSTIVVNTYDANGALEATRLLGSGPSGYSVAALLGGGFAVSLRGVPYGSSPVPDELVFFDDRGIETRREPLPQFAGGLEMMAFPDGRILIGNTIFDPRTSYDGVTSYGGVAYQIGGAGDDIITAQAGADRVHGWTGNDIIVEGSGAQGLLSGDDGDDLIILDGIDIGESADGGPGNDTLALILLNRSTTVDLTAGFVRVGSDSFAVTGFENFSSSEAVSFTVLGTGGANTITTGSGDDALAGGDGDDVLDGGGGADLMAGGAGNDVYVVDSIFDSVREDPDGGTADEVRTAIANYALPANVERLVYTGTAPTTLAGTAGNNVFTGGSNGDYFNLSQGGDDTANGGDGNDAFFFGAAFTAADRVDGGPGGNDQVGLQGDYTGTNRLVLGADTLTGVEVLAALPGYSYDIVTVDATVPGGTEFVIFGGALGSADNLTFDGSAERDGRFRTFGGLGIDTLTGGAQDDGFYFGPGKWGASDVVHGGGGANDQLGLDGNYTITLDARADVEVVVLLPGTPLAPASYALTLAAAFTPAGETRTIFATAVTTALAIDASAETNGALRLFGGGAADSLTGGAGDDFIFGNLGGDTVRGGAGRDTFFYDGAAQSSGTAYDRLVDFDYAQDRIRIDGQTHDTYRLVAAGTLSSATFDTDLATALNTALTGGAAAFFTPGAGTLSGKTFLVVDANGIDGYQSGQDYVFEMPAAPVGAPTDFLIA